MNQAVKNPDIKSILKGITIPSPPQIIVDLQLEMSNSNPDINEMANLISNDAGLAGAVLKTINSPFYGGGGKVSSISNAVMMLGMNTIVDIVNTLCLRNSIKEEEMSENLYATLIRFWDSAADIAKVCSMLGQRLKISPLDHIYSLGLFHNVGITLLVNKHEDYLDTIRTSYSQNKKRIVDIENEKYGSNHAVIGYYVARAWKLDEVLAQHIAQHHNLEIFSDDAQIDPQKYRLLAVLKIAEHIVGLYRILGNQAEDLEWRSIRENVLLCAGLSEYDLEDIKQQALEYGFGQQQYFR